MKKIKMILLSCLLALSTSAMSNERLITSGGMITEIVDTLGESKQLVGMDLSSTYLTHLSQIPNIGYWKQLNLEGILALKPTLVIAWDDSKPDYIFPQLEKLNIKVVKLQRTPNDLERLFTNIRLIASALDKQEAGETLIANINADVSKTLEQVSQQSVKPNVIFLFSMQGTTQVAGKETVADGIIAMAGGNNVAKHHNYQIYGAEDFINANPDVIIVSKESYDKIGMEGLSKNPGITYTNAWKNKQIIVIDNELILGMGPRIGTTLSILYQGFYPTHK